jgi:hypothetical protein
MYEYSPAQFLAMEEMNSFEVKLYPNPTADYITIEQSKVISSSEVSVYNCFGQIVLQLNNLNDSFTKLDVTHLPAGIYTVSILDENKKTVYSNELIRL